MSAKAFSWALDQRTDNPYAQRKDSEGHPRARVLRKSAQGGKMKDTFEKFDAPDRGRFGENEDARGSPHKSSGGKISLVDVALIRFAETAKAVLAGETLDKSKAVWLPKSQVEIHNDGHDNFITVTMPQWLAKDKGLV